MQLDHFLFRAHDMAKMATFFEQVLRLKEGLRPPFPFPFSAMNLHGLPTLILGHITPVR
jgi:catechol 2,3-dioxygenase-like lactoylglutathione lyase family enzyme